MRAIKLLMILLTGLLSVIVSPLLEPISGVLAADVTITDNRREHQISGRNGVPSLLIDDVRDHYLKLEDALWKYLSNEDGRPQREQIDQLRKIFDNHRIFIFENMRQKYEEGDYFILNSYYEWRLLEKEIIGISGLFEYFKSFIFKYNEKISNNFVENEEFFVLSPEQRLNLNSNNDKNQINLAVIDLTMTILNDTNLQIPEALESINNVMTGQALYYRAMLDANEQLCAIGQSAQQFLYSLYTDIALTELKGYTMLQFSWMMLKIYDRGNFTHEAALAREDFENRSLRTRARLQEIMTRADRIVWRCDPPDHVRGVTYEEITRLLQGYVENEVDMNPDQTCRENCAYYGITRNYGCFKDLYCSRQPRCSGRLLNCQFVDSDMWICPASSNNTRRYEYIEYENGSVLGQKTSCVRGTTKVDSWWRWLFWHCSYCFCLCDEQGAKSDRYFSLREALSNIDENRVVTGLRFTKKKRIIHLQIQEGQLLPKGIVNSTSLQWKSIEVFNVFDRNVRSERDYHTLAWDKRAIDLDDVTDDDPKVIVTGVRFRVVGAHLNLEARLTEFNFETGELIEKDNSFWKSNDNTDQSERKRTIINLRNPDVPIRSRGRSLPTSKHNQYIEFTNTDLHKDAAQTTVPFVDIQDVTSNPPVPLAGIGIYHKGRDGYGGFVAPKLITYNFAPHVGVTPAVSENRNRVV